MKKISEQELIRAMENGIDVKVSDLNADIFTTLGVDSLDQIQMITSIEDAIGVANNIVAYKFPEGEFEKKLGTLRTAKQFIELLKQEGYVE